MYAIVLCRLFIYFFNMRYIGGVNIIFRKITNFKIIRMDSMKTNPNNRNGQLGRNLHEQAESSSNLGTRKSIQSQDSQTTSRGDIDISTQDRPKKISFLSPQGEKMKWMWQRDPQNPIEQSPRIINMCDSSFSSVSWKYKQHVCTFYQQLTCMFMQNEIKQEREQIHTKYKLIMVN